MLGSGTPSAVQVKLIAGPPSRTTWSRVLVLNDGGSAKETRIKESLSLMICFDHSSFKKRSYDLNATAITELYRASGTN